MLRHLRRVAVMTARTWFREQPDRRQGHDRRQCPDRRMDFRVEEVTANRRCRERRYPRPLFSSN